MVEIMQFHISYENYCMYCHQSLKSVELVQESFPNYFTWEQEEFN